MSNYFRKINKETVDHIKYRNTVMTGEITAVNTDGTYNVKIAQAGSAYPDVETLDYNANFSVGEIVDIAFEYGNRELPKIMGTAKKIAQEPSVVETDYSSGTGGGKQTETVIIYCTNASGTISATSTNDNYNKCHNSIDGDDLYNFDIDTSFLYIDQAYLSPRYGIERGYLIFNILSVPTDATITSAILSLYCINNGEITTDFNIVIQNGQPDYPHNPIIDSDYYYANYSNNGGQKLASTFTLNAYNNITLNSNGINWINKGGITKFCLRSSRDIAGTAPTDSTNYIGAIAGTAYSGKTDYAKLTITYEI
jgi:hypothetical protein